MRSVTSLNAWIPATASKHFLIGAEYSKLRKLEITLWALHVFRAAPEFQTSFQEMTLIHKFGSPF